LHSLVEVSIFQKLQNVKELHFVGAVQCALVPFESLNTGIMAYLEVTNGEMACRHMTGMLNKQSRTPDKS
jgi:hypothetical protein